MKLTREQFLNVLLNIGNNWDKKNANKMYNMIELSNNDIKGFQFQGSKVYVVLV